jgi:predicted PurR-regulated permease PerM
VTAIVGAVGLVLAMGLMWVVYDSTSSTVNSLVADLEATTTEAQGKYDAAAAALDEQAGRAVNPDGQALLEDGADLVREVGAQVGSIDGQVGNLVDSLLTVLLVIVGLLTALLAYLVLVHGGIWTLGRHWRRD